MQPQQPASAAYQIPPQRSPKTIVATVILAILFIAALVFGIWAYQGRQNYKNNSDKKVAAAVTSAQKAQAAKDQASFDQQLKAPYKTFAGSATYGSIGFSYPKTWSVYVDSSSSDEPINGYFYPDIVPSTQGNNAFALRVELVGSAYSDVLNNFGPQISDGTVTASAYIPPKMNGVANAQPGMMLVGAIGQDNGNGTTQGAMVILKVRDKTLEVYTQSNSFLSDFNNIVLPDLTFKP